MNKRTPGKWELLTDFSVWSPSENALVCVCHHGDKRLRDSREISQEEAHANARLIATAPDLLALLKEWDEPGACGCDTATCRGTCLPARTRDAIANATRERS